MNNYNIRTEPRFLTEPNKTHSEPNKSFFQKSISHIATGGGIKMQRDDTNVFENHEMIDEEDSLALEQLPDRLQPLPLVLTQHRHAVATSRVGQQVHQLNVLSTPQNYMYD